MIGHGPRNKVSQHVLVSSQGLKHLSGVDLGGRQGVPPYFQPNLTFLRIRPCLSLLKCERFTLKKYRFQVVIFFNPSSYLF